MPYECKTGSRKILKIICAVIVGAMLMNVMCVTGTGDTQLETVTFTKKNISSADLRRVSDVSESELEEYLERFPRLKDISAKLIEVQEEYEVNAIFMLAVIRLESGNGTSSLAIKKNNLGGITGAKKGRSIYRSFDSRSECVEYMARLLSENYLDSDGKYFNGYTVRAVSKKYCVSDTWTAKIEKIMLEIQYKIDELRTEKNE